MPIRINLLSEAQALEELRRRDPVKRALYAGFCLVALMLMWSLFLYSKGIVGKSELSRRDADLESHAEEYQRALANQRRLTEVGQRLAALQQMATNRYLNGNVLQALQQTTVPEVRLARLKTDQVYVFTEATHARTNASGRVLEPARPATVTERIVLTLDARDSSPNPGDQVNRFKENIAATPSFSALLGKANEPTLRNLSPPQMDPVAGRAFLLFTLECRCLEIVR